MENQPKILTPRIYSDSSEEAAEQRLLLRFAKVRTSVFTDKPVSMKYRGIFELARALPRVARTAERLEIIPGGAVPPLANGLDVVDHGGCGAHALPLTDGAERMVCEHHGPQPAPLCRAIEAPSKLGISLALPLVAPVSGALTFRTVTPTR